MKVLKRFYSFHEEYGDRDVTITVVIAMMLIDWLCSLIDYVECLID